MGATIGVCGLSAGAEPSPAYPSYVYVVDIKAVIHTVGGDITIVLDAEIEVCAVCIAGERW